MFLGRPSHVKEWPVSSNLTQLQASAWWNDDCMRAFYVLLIFTYALSDAGHLHNTTWTSCGDLKLYLPHCKKTKSHEGMPLLSNFIQLRTSTLCYSDCLPVCYVLLIFNVISDTFTTPHNYSCNRSVPLPPRLPILLYQRATSTVFQYLMLLVAEPDKQTNYLVKQLDKIYNYH